VQYSEYVSVNVASLYVARGWSAVIKFNAARRPPAQCKAISHLGAEGFCNEPYCALAAALRYNLTGHYCCTALYCTDVYCCVLYCTALMYCTVIHSWVLYCPSLYYNVLHCTALYCTVLHCTALHRTALYLIPASPRIPGQSTTLHCTAHSALLCTALHTMHNFATAFPQLKFSVYCSTAGG
jgi:hypothetical protein